MKQSKLMSMLETCLSTAIGFGISLGAQIVFLPMLGVPINLHQNFAFAVIMTFVSLARQFLVRRLFEALHIRQPMSPAAAAILAERRRQIDVEGWSSEHDDEHRSGEMAQAGAAYALHRAASVDDHIRRHWQCTDKGLRPNFWPWAPEWWKPVDFRRDLVRAGALILAELERFDRNKRKRADAPAASPDAAAPSREHLAMTEN